MSETPRPDWTEHDAKLAALYRAAALDEPSPALDDAIRAAARRAVASRPQIAGLPSRSWRVPLSVAAVVLLSVSLITVMREEVPEIALPPRADTQPPDTGRKPAEFAPAAGESNTTVPQILLPGEQKPKSVGLKPPQQAQSTGIGIHGYTLSPEPVTESKKEMAAADRLEAGGLSSPLFAKRAVPEAFPGPVAAPAAASARAGGAATESKDDLRLETDSVTRESSRARVQAAPVVKPLALPAASQTAGTVQAQAGPPPAKWLERIEDLRKQGKIEEARASLAEFKQNFPDYPLPASLATWSKP